MRDLQADWRRWTCAERVMAMVFSVAAGFATPALFLLDTL